MTGQIVVIGLLAFIFWRFLTGRGGSGIGSLSDDSSFGARESDQRRGKKAGVKAEAKLADAKLKKHKQKDAGPALLTGIQIQGAPHEVLGIHPFATEETIQKAYRERMKQYHPDKIARPGTDQWREAQQIAEAINRARVEMLKRVSKRS